MPPYTTTKYTFTLEPEISRNKTRPVVFQENPIRKFEQLWRISQQFHWSNKIRKGFYSYVHKLIREQNFDYSCSFLIAFPVRLPWSNYFYNSK